MASSDSAHVSSALGSPHTGAGALVKGHGGFVPPTIFFVGLLLYTMSVFTNLGARLDFLSAIRHEFIAGLVLTVLAAYSLASFKLDLDYHRILIIAIFSLLAIELSQVPFAVFPAKAWAMYFNYIFKLSMFALFMAAFMRTPNHLRWFIGVFLFSLFWVYQESTRGWMTGGMMWYNQGILRLHGSVPLYKHPNGLSLIAVTGVPFLLAIFPVVRSKILRLIMLGMGAMIVPIIIYTGSRAGYLGAIAMVVAWWLSSRHRGRIFVVVAIAAAITVTTLPEQYKGRFKSINGKEAAGHSRESRLLIMQDAWAIFLDHPFGVGVDCFTVVRTQRFGRVQYTHNLYLQVATHLGIQGLAVFAFFVWALFYSFHIARNRLHRLELRAASLARDKRLHRRDRTLLGRYYRDAEFTGAVARAGMLYLVMLLVNGVFNHSLYLICWWLVSGMAFASLTVTTHLERSFPVYRLFESDGNV